MNENDTGFLVIFLGLILLFVLVYLVPALIGSWMLYARAKQPGWTALVPFYATYIMGKIAKQTNLGIVVAIGILLQFVDSIYPELFTGLTEVVFYSVYIVVSLALLVLWVLQYTNRALLVLWLLFPFIGIFFLKSVKYKQSNLSSS